LNILNILVVYKFEFVYETIYFSLVVWYIYKVL
jgi:hypothetical protein